MTLFSTVLLAAEDRVGLACGRKLIEAFAPLTVDRVINKHGNAGLRRQARSYLQMARHGLPMIIVTDLDQAPCATSLLQDWLGADRHENFLLRIAVREVEAWLLADRQALARAIQLSPAALPDAPEALADPKAELLRLARRAPRRVSEALLPKANSTAIIGPGYNDFFERFVRDDWSWQRASRQSSSLQRAVTAVRRLAERCAASET